MPGPQEREIGSCRGVPAGPLGRPSPLAGGGVRSSSVNKGKAAELKDQAAAIAEASAFQGQRFLRSAAPGRIEGPGGRTLEVLAADASSGHASGFNDVVIDELRLLAERDRPLVNGLRSSTRARDGRVLHLTIWGSGPFVPELVELEGDPAVAVHLYQAAEGCELTDPEEWAAANPRLGRSSRWRRCATAPGSPRATRRTRPTSGRTPEPARHPLHGDDRDGGRLAAVPAPGGRPPGPSRAGGDRAGRWRLQLDHRGRLHLARPVRGLRRVLGDPALIERGQLDGVGRRYQVLADAGELRVYGAGAPRWSSSCATWRTTYRESGWSSAGPIASGRRRCRTRSRTLTYAGRASGGHRRERDRGRK